MGGGRGYHPPRPIFLPTFTATGLKDGTVLVVGASYRTDTLRIYFPGGFSFNELASPDAYGPSAELYTPARPVSGSGLTPLMLGLILAAAAAAAAAVVLGAVLLLRRTAKRATAAAEPAPAQA